MENVGKTMEKSDHDMLIILDTKFDSFLLELKMWKNDVFLKINDLETRLRVVEKTHDEVNPIESQKRIVELLQWKRDLQNAWKWGIAVLVVVAGFIGYFISQAPSYYNFFKK